MTEQASGSDVAVATTTIAKKITDKAMNPDGNKYRLYGFKWFTSAVDARVAIALARIEDGQGQTTKGTNGLSCFLVHVRAPVPGEADYEHHVFDSAGTTRSDDVQGDGDRSRLNVLNDIKVNKLKVKLGTKQLPTAELELHGTVGYLISAKGRGIATISHLFNVTRIYNAIAAVGYMRRMTALAKDYACRRRVFGTFLKELPAQQLVLAHMEAVTRGCVYAVMDTAYLEGKLEAGTISKNEASLLRLLTPLGKLYTGKESVKLCSEGIEAFGAYGYMEDSKIPRLLRDAQVLPIWEGTTNVCSHDVLRVLEKDKGQSVRVMFDIIKTRCAQARAVAGGTGAVVEKIQKGMDDVNQFLDFVFAGQREGNNDDNASAKVAPTDRAQRERFLHMYSRDLCMGLFRLYVASGLLAQSTWAHEEAEKEWTKMFTQLSGARKAGIIVGPVAFNAPVPLVEAPVHRQGALRLLNYDAHVYNPAAIVILAGPKGYGNNTNRTNTSSMSARASARMYSAATLHPAAVEGSSRKEDSAAMNRLYLQVR